MSDRLFVIQALGLNVLARSMMGFYASARSMPVHGQDASVSVGSMLWIPLSMPGDVECQCCWFLA